jgi:hypothetical protein
VRCHVVRRLAQPDPTVIDGIPVTSLHRLELVRGAGLPEPACNVYVEGQLVDFVWRPQRPVVEIDHYRPPGSRRSFEEDRAAIGSAAACERCRSPS